MGWAAEMPFGKRLNSTCARIKAVATDMSVAYIQAVRVQHGNAVHVLDRIHVTKLYDKKLSDFQRELFRASGERNARASADGVALANAEELGKPRSREGRVGAARRGVSGEPAVGRALLRERRPAANVEASRDSGLLCRLLF